MNQKALLHRASFAVLVVLCCALRGQTLTEPPAQMPAQAVATQADTKASLQAVEKNAKTQYMQALQTCNSKLAPAQCKRQAGLDYKQAQHNIKLKREQLDTAKKQAKHAASQAEKANNVATAKQGVDSAGKPLERAPLTKPQSPKKNAAQSSQPVQPLSKQSNIKQTNKPKTPLAKKETLKTKPDAVIKPLAAQPTPEQRRANVADFAKKEAELTARKTQVNTKQAKRTSKDAQRQAAGYSVDKP